MPNWKKVVTSGSNANLNHITASGTIYASSASIGPTGTATSSAQLTVSGSISASGDLYLGGDDQQYIKFGDATDDNAGQIFYNHSGDALKISTGAQYRLTISSSGTTAVADTVVGIGTQTPTKTLTVSGSISASGDVDATTVSASTFYFGDGTTQTTAGGGGGTGNWFDGSTYQTSSVGIIVTGSISASGDLFVEGSVHAQQYIVSSSVTTMSIVQASGSTIFGDTTNDTHQFTGSIYQVGSTAHGYPLWTMKNEGNSGEFWHFINDIGETVVSYNQSLAGAAELSLYGSGSNPTRTHRFADASSGASSWVAYSADSSSVNYFGVGTANPSAHLHVSGNIKYSGDLIPVNEAEAAGQRAAFGTTDTGSNETVTVQGNISASGNLFVHGISASGEIFLEKEKRIRFGSDDTFISSSGTVEDLWIRADDDIVVEAGDDIYLTAGDDIYLTYGYDNKFILRNSSNQKTIEIDDADDSITLTGNITASGDISTTGNLYLSSSSYLDPADIHLDGLGNNIYFNSGSGAHNTSIKGIFGAINVYSGSTHVHTLHDEASGNVGIHTTSPPSDMELTVSGSISSSGDLYTGDITLQNHHGYIKDASGHQRIQFTDNGYTIFKNHNGNTSVWVDSTAGRLGIGTTVKAVSRALEVEGDISASGGMTLQSSMSIGTQTHAPNMELTVEGDISASGHLYLQDTKKIIGTGRLNISSSGTLTLVAGGNYTFNQQIGGGNFKYVSSSATPFQIHDGTGEVTIGTIVGTPNESGKALTVFGDISASGGLTIESSASIGTTTQKGMFTIDYGTGHQMTGSLTNPGDGYGDVVSFAVTSSVNVGDIVFFKGSVGNWQKADASTAALTYNLMGVSLGNNDVLLRGFAKINPITGSLTSFGGDPIYLSEMAGSGSWHAPAASGEFVRVIGHLIGSSSNDTIYFNPDSTWVERT